jgi:predicted Zn-dependent protease with MMP-like domain
VFEVSDERFGEMIEAALATIPPQLADHMDNVAIFVEDEAEGRSLFGLYEGIPLTKRSAGYGAGGVMPDKITLYRRAICSHCSTEEEVAEQVRITLVHEVAHHFGISDPRLEELGW